VPIEFNKLSRNVGLPGRRLNWILAGTIVLIFIIGLAAALFEWARLSSLYNQVFDENLTSIQRAEAVRLISIRSCIMSRQFLVEIALDRQADIDSRTEAARELSRCGSAHSSEDLSALLQPHVALILREAVAKTINEVGCTEICTASILHYLERDWHGETEMESRVKGIEILPETKQEIHELAEALESILVEHKVETYDVLNKIYGLGTPNPSHFAIHMVGTLKLREACGALQSPFRSVPPPPSLEDEISHVLGTVCSQH
jgi:hypothetical protein